jgi:hypothetical protein
MVDLLYRLDIRDDGQTTTQQRFTGQPASRSSNWVSAAERRPATPATDRFSKWRS